jgi:hypothetical protein
MITETETARPAGTVSARAGVRDLWIVAALIVCFAAIRLPFLSHYLINWDAVQYALGSRDFDLHHHQPHPPGYIGYIFLARLLNHLTGDANQSLVLISVVGGALAPAGLYRLARAFVARPFALLAAILFGTSPLLWYYSGVALNYAPAAAIALWMVWACHMARTQRSTRHLAAATVLLAALGALRQTDMAFLVPVWAYSVWAFPRRERTRAAALLGILTLAWLVPLLWLSGGPLAYLRESIALYRMVGGNTSIFTRPIHGLARNGFMVLLGIVIGANVGLIAIGAAAWRYRRRVLDPGGVDRTFVLLWAGPALAVYLFGHTGQFGYVLLVLPIVLLWVALSLALLFEDRAASARPAETWDSPLAENGLFAGAISLLLVVNVVSFILLPPMLYNRVSDGGLAANSSLAREMLQYDIRENDRHWRDTIELIRQYDPATTVVLTSLGGPRLSGGFRELSYYLPQYQIFGIGRDRSNHIYGYLFTSFQGYSNYSLSGLDAAQRTLPLPPTARQVIIPDQEVAERFDLVVTRTLTGLNDGSVVVVAVLPAGTSLAFSDGRIVSDQFDRSAFWSGTPDDR